MKGKNRMKGLLVSGWFLLVCGSASAQVNGLIKDGNKNYNIKDYKNAEKAYGKALGKDPDSYNASFNMGDALYKLKKYKEASGYFDRSAGLTKDRAAAAKSYYNLGNSYMAMGQTDEGIKAYKKALKMNPDDVYAKYNLSYANKEKKEKEKQQQQNQQQQQQQNNQENQNGNQNIQPQQKGNQQSNQDQRKSEGNMTQEEAERIMNAINNNEQAIRKRLYNGQKADAYKTDKPW